VLYAGMLNCWCGRALVGGQLNAMAQSVPASDSASIAVAKCLLTALSSVLLGKICRSILLA
jgi:hypothetical protein